MTPDPDDTAARVTEVDLAAVREHYAAAVAAHHYPWTIEMLTPCIALWASAHDVPGLLARIAELEGECRHLAEERLRVALKLEGARREGRQWAIDALRDHARWLPFLTANDELLYEEEGQLAADYLEHLAAQPDNGG